MSETASVFNVLNFLASQGVLATTTVTAAVADDVMLQTGGNILSRGVLYDIISKQVSPHVYRLSLKRTN